MPLLIPAALTGLFLLVSGGTKEGVQIAAAVGLAFFAFIGSASIGWFYLPATVVAFMALSRPRENGTPQGILQG